MLVVGAKDIEKLHKFLTDLDDTALPFAARDALNTAAFAHRREWENQGRLTMHVRNRWTFKGQHHQVKKARMRKTINQMEAVAGNTHRYMAQQESGFTRWTMRGKGLQIPTTPSRIGSNIKRTVSRAYWRNRMRVQGEKYRVGDFKSQKQYAAASIRAARKAGKGFVYLDFGGSSRGIFDVRKKRRKLKPEKLVWRMNQRSATTQPNPMLYRTIKKLEPVMPQYYKSELENQIRFVLRKRGIRTSTQTSMISRALL